MDFNDDQFELSRYKWVIPFVAVILVISLIIIKGSSNNLKGYVENQSSDNSSSSVKDINKDDNIELSENTVLYSDDTYSFSFMIPESWSKVNGSGSDVSFINKQTGTKLQVNVLTYDPQINTVDENFLIQQASANGMEVREYSKPTNSSYFVSYCSSDYGYIEYSFWDYSAIIKLNFCVDIKYYNDEQMNKTLKYIVNSFEWKKSDPIPEGITPKYISYGNFEFGFPEGWNYGESGNTIVMTNQEGSASFTITVNEAAASLENISQIEYINYISQSKPDFMLTNFSNDGQKISITGEYMLNGQKLNLQQYIIVNNGFEYNLSFDTEVAVTSELTVTIQNVINSFRCY